MKRGRVITVRFQGKKVLVTGGAGFVGSILVDKLVSENAEVTVLDDMFTGRIENISSYNEIRFIKDSITNYKLVEKLVREVDLVFNLAVRNIIVSTRHPELDFEVNARGIFNILLAARNYGIERIIYTSSASIYGNPRYLPINENDNINILNPYAASKLTAENYCFAFYETYKVPMAILRYSNVYGINQFPENPYCGVVSRFFESAMKGKAIKIHGDGEQTRDFTFVDDVVEATLLAAISPKAEGEVFNVGSGIETSINHLARQILNLNGNCIEPVHIDRRDIDNIRRRVLNIEKIRHTLRWIPSVTLENGLKRTYAWLRSKQHIEKKYVAIV